MNDAQRIDRLSQALNGTGATVNGPFSVWGRHTAVTDAHLHDLGGWADLEPLVLSGCPITDDVLPAICQFQRLQSLDIGGTKISSDGISSADLPKSIAGLGLSQVRLTDGAAGQIAMLPNLRSLNCNHCDLSTDAFMRFVAVPGLRSLEAIGCSIPDEIAEEITLSTPVIHVRLDSGIWKAGIVQRRASES